MASHNISVLKAKNGTLAPWRLAGKEASNSDNSSLSKKDTIEKPEWNWFFYKISLLKQRYGHGKQESRLTSFLHNSSVFRVGIFQQNGKGHAKTGAW